MDQLKQNIYNMFPMKPYSLQTQIAMEIYKALDSNIKLIVIQSPTGTGKTYSLLVPVIAWLKQNDSKVQSQELKERKSVPSWIKKTGQKKGQKLLMQKKKTVLEMKHVKDLQQILKNNRLAKAQKVVTSTKDISEDEALIDSEQQNYNQSNKKGKFSKSDLMIERQLQLQNTNILPKLIFVSRTHSQLSQVLSSAQNIINNKDQLQCLQMGSKQQLCINKAINEHKSSVSQKCQYLLDHQICPFNHKLQLRQFFWKDMQQANKLGQQHSICPYFASRNLLQYSDIVLLPYSSILSEDIRCKMGINLNNSIVIFDEGHNVLQFQKQLHSPQIFREDVEAVAQQLDQYLNKFKDRMKVKNYNLVMHFLQICRAILGIIDKYVSEGKSNQQKYVKIDYLNFLIDLGIKQMKSHKISKYVSLTNFDKKLAYFNSSSQISPKNKIKNQANKVTVAKVNKIVNFIVELSQFKQQKQVLMIKWVQNSRGSIKIICFQGQQLQRIIRNSKMTIIAGGTMQPLDDFTPMFQQWKQRAQVKKYNHIIKQGQCSIAIVGKINKQDITFNHQNLNNPLAHEHFKTACIAVVSKVLAQTQTGGGVVIFIQSYHLLHMFRSIFQLQKYYPNMLFDSRQKQQGQVQDVFIKYKKLVEQGKEEHYILVSVMGGKLSEGINFSDKLARSLIVFGLPYPNRFAPQIIESMHYYDNRKWGSYTGKKYYQNMCFRTLNQTIGRGIRHINDYVNIYLVDSRFAGIQTKLSAWMRPFVKTIQL